MAPNGMPDRGEMPGIPPKMPDGGDLPPSRGPRLPGGFVRKRWKFLIGVPLIILFLFIWPKPWPMPGPQICLEDNCRTIVAQKVTADANNGLTGTFVVEKAYFNAIPSDGIAGACLFVESAALTLPAAATPPGGVCTTDAHCGGLLQNDPSTSEDDAFVGWEGLCRGGACWIRPGKGAAKSAVCNKGIKAVDGIPNNANDTPFDPSTLKDKLTDSAKNKPIGVRVIACLNSPFTPDPSDPNFKPPCAGGPWAPPKFATGDPEAFSIGQ